MAEENIKRQREDEREYRLRQLKLVADLYIRLITLFIPIMGLYFLLNNITPFTFDFKSTDKTDIQNLQRQFNNLDRKYNIVTSQLAKTANDSPTNSLLLRIASIEAKQQALSETILIDPDKALTARLLREQQKHLEDKFTKTQADQAALNNRIDSFITTAVAIPIGGAVLSLLSGLVIYLFSKFKTSNGDSTMP